MGKIERIEVPADDRARLEGLVRDRNTPQKLVWRARIVLLTGEGLRALPVAEAVGKSVLTVRDVLTAMIKAHEIQGVTAPLDAPEKVTAAALEHTDSLARQTLRHFCEILGRVAGNGVLTLGSTGGVYLCGGILPRFLDFFLESPFRSGFEDKGRMRPLLEFTPVYVVTVPYTGLLGAAEALANPEV